MSKFMLLLVEDDVLQRALLADALKDDGFEVIECASAEAAELVVASTGTELQALITDHNLAGEMTGAELAQYSRRSNPKVQVILMSGTLVNPMPRDTLFLQKPFPPSQLLAAVRH